MARNRRAKCPWRLRKAAQLEPGATTTWVSSGAGGRYLVSKIDDRGGEKSPPWRLTHQPSGAQALVWTRRAATELLRRLLTPPERESDRWVILPRPDLWRGQKAEGQVLFDRGTGRWWPRSPDKLVTGVQLEIMSRLCPLPVAPVPLPQMPEARAGESYQTELQAQDTSPAVPSRSRAADRR